MKFFLAMLVSITALFLVFVAAQAVNMRVGTGEALLAASGTAKTPAYVLPGVVNTINMVNFSQHYENSYWTKTNIQDTTFATKTIAPDGTNTGEKLIPNTTNGFHDVQTPPIVKSGVSTAEICTIFAKVGGYTRLYVQVQNNTGAANTQAVYDLAGLQVSHNTTFGSGWSTDPAHTDIISVENGWVRLRLGYATDTVGHIQIQIFPDNGSGTAAASLSFAGDGTSGVFLWTVNCLPTHAWDLIAKSFEDNFTSLSTIDLSNAKTHGFNWYGYNGWPNAGDGGSLSLAWRNSLPQQAGDFTLASPGITGALSRAGQSGIGETLVSAVTDGSTGYIGRTFTLPQYSEATYAYDSTLATTTAFSWPINWSFCIEYLIGATTHCVENDIGEGHPSGAGTVSPDSTFHDWNISGSTGTNIQSNLAGAGMGGLTYTAQNRYGVLWISQAANGGTFGLRQTYVNGVYVNNSETSYSSSTVASPTFTGNTSGVFSVGDSQHFPIMLAAGTGASGVGNWPVTWTHAVVYCPLSGCMTVNFLEKRDIDPKAANDNDPSPMFLNEVA